MLMFNISVSDSRVRLLVLFCLLIVNVSTKNLNSISNYHFDNDDEESKNFLTFPSDSYSALNNFNTRSEGSTGEFDYDSQNGQIRILPFKKRIIPIELQKALYAHGIVGRRR